VASTREEIAWLVDRVDELAQGLKQAATNEIQSQLREVMDRRQRGDESPDLLVTALASSREALRRTTGAWLDALLIGSVAAAVAGAVSPLPRRQDRQLALAMVLHWHSLAGKGVHFLSWDEKAARDAAKRFDRLGALLNCDVGLVIQSTTRPGRRSAYGATVTFGSCTEMAADYLRDNLHDSRTEVVQRELYAAVTDDVDTRLVSRALSHVLITAPRKLSTPSPEVEAIVASFRRGSEYRVDRKQQAIVFSASAVSRLKAAVGWGAVPSLRAVTAAERIERMIAVREGLAGSQGREALAEISVQGYLSLYERFTAFSSNSNLRGTVDDVLMQGVPDIGELTFERLIDRQRSIIYTYRAGVRDASDTLVFLRPIIADAVDVWLARGAATLSDGVNEVLAGYQTREHINIALESASSESELADRAILLIQTAVDQRKNALGVAQTANLLQRVLLTVIDLQWRDHINWIRFLQRQSLGLYSSAADVGEARNADAHSLFAACEQAIRVESIKYLLNARV
jgi:preprotein translocase subunit SecA